MAQRQKYIVVIPFPMKGGHWSAVDQELDLLEVEAQQLEAVGRIKLKPVDATPTKKATATAAKEA